MLAPELVKHFFSFLSVDRFAFEALRPSGRRNLVEALFFASGFFIFFGVGAENVPWRIHAGILLCGVALVGPSGLVLERARTAEEGLVAHRGGIGCGHDDERMVLDGVGRNSE